MLNGLSKKCSAEAIGTFTLVYAGCGAIAMDTLGHAGICAVFGLVVACMVFATGHISGAHLNPAVTLAFTAGRHLPPREAPWYIVAQLVGASLAALAVEFTLGPIDSSVTTFSTPAGPVFVLEALLTFFLMFVITAVATDGRAEGQLAAVAIGSIVAVGALVGGPISGASMNPARSLGPALVAGQMNALWLYLIAPTIGAVSGHFAYKAVACEPTKKDPSGCC